MARQLSLDALQEGFGVLIILLSSGSHHMHRELVEEVKDGSTNLVVCGVSRPEVRWRSAGNARHAAQRRGAKDLVFSHQKARPGPQVRKELVEFPVQLMVRWDLSVSLLDVLHDVDDLTQDSIESGDRIVRWRCVGVGRTGPLFRRIREALVHGADVGASLADPTF
jgi:hypothetical protein